MGEWGGNWGGGVNGGGAFAFYSLPKKPHRLKPLQFWNLLAWDKYGAVGGGIQHLVGCSIIRMLAWLFPSLES